MSDEAEGGRGREMKDESGQGGKLKEHKEEEGEGREGGRAGQGGLRVRAGKEGYLHTLCPREGEQQ